MLILGSAGGSGSGKSTFADLLRADLEGEDLAVIRHDSYYIPLDHLPLEQRKHFNFDHPQSLDNTLLIQDLKKLRAGQTIQVPEYDFKLYNRKRTHRAIAPPTVLIVEGILIYCDPQLRALFDMKIFIDTDDDNRLIRRILRDTQERGRDLAAILDQYQSTVKPMHLEFVEPSKRWADLIVPRGGRNKVGLDLLGSKLKTLLSKNH